MSVVVFNGGRWCDWWEVVRLLRDAGLFQAAAEGGAAFFRELDVVEMEQRRAQPGGEGGAGGGVVVAEIAIPRGQGGRRGVFLVVLGVEGGALFHRLPPALSLSVNPRPPRFGKL